MTYNLAKIMTQLKQALEKYEFVHSIQIERYMRIFEKVHRNSETIARNIACVCSVRAPTRIRDEVLKFRF